MTLEQPDVTREELKEINEICEAPALYKAAFDALAVKAERFNRKNNCTCL